MGKKVITVLGPVTQKSMGFTDAHNHLWISAQTNQKINSPVLDQQQQIIEELALYKDAGGDSQVDCQPGGSGRDGNKLKILAEESGVNIVGCTGFHLRDYYPENSLLWNLSLEQAYDSFVSEISQGMAETRGKDHPVYPGFIKIAVMETIEDSPLKLIEAAVAASIKTGYAIQMHTEKGKNAEYFLEHISALGLPLTSLIICHLDKRPDLGLHQELAQTGCRLEYDTFFRPKYHPEKNLWMLIREMVAAGYHRSIVFASDLADSHMWKTMGKGPGLAGFLTNIKQRLNKEGLDPNYYF